MCKLSAHRERSGLDRRRIAVWLLPPAAAAGIATDHSFSGVVEHNGRRYRFVRPARRRRDPSADGFRNSMGHRASYEYVYQGPKRARVGAASTEAAIHRLLREVRAGDASQTECAVCLQDYAADETVRAMPVCAHAFHHHCISEWLSRKAVCPICRRELPLPTATQEEEEEEEWVRVPTSARSSAGRNWW